MKATSILLLSASLLLGACRPSGPRHIIMLANNTGSDRTDEAFTIARNELRPADDNLLPALKQADGTYVEEVIPSTLNVGGTLRVENGTKLRVLVRKTLQGASWVSCVETQMLNLPMVGAADGGETLLDVTVEIEPGASASNVKILGWQGLAGGGKVNGTVTVVDPQGNPVEGSFTLRQKSDGLYLYRSNSRFWMILR